VSRSALVVRRRDRQPVESGTHDGELTIKGLSRPITATGTYERPVEDPYGYLRAAVELRAVLDRRDWGMSWQQPLPDGTDIVGWEIELTVQLELVNQR
jgi:polyisoprenoid-binding protein YceI